MQLSKCEINNKFYIYMFIKHPPADFDELLKCDPPSAVTFLTFLKIVFYSFEWSFNHRHGIVV